MELLAQHLRHSIGFEVGGAGLAYSLNYENMSANGFTKRIGLALETQGFAVPFQLGKMFGNEKHHFEVAGGLTYWYDPLIYKDTRIHRHRCVASALLDIAIRSLHPIFIFAQSSVLSLESMIPNAATVSYFPGQDSVSEAGFEEVI
jgi:hypothetical protein